MINKTPKEYLQVQIPTKPGLLSPNPSTPLVVEYVKHVTVELEYNKPFKGLLKAFGVGSHGLLKHLPMLFYEYMKETNQIVVYNGLGDSVGVFPKYPNHSPTGKPNHQFTQTYIDWVFHNEDLVPVAAACFSVFTSAPSGYTLLRLKVFKMFQEDLQKFVEMVISGFKSGDSKEIDKGIIGVDFSKAKNKALEILETEWGPDPKQQEEEMAVKLINATKIGQEVASTSAGSVYIVVALHKDLKIAARFKPGGISIRVEGIITPHKDTLVQAGYDLKGGDDSYASVHIQVDGMYRYKTLGSMLFGLGLDFEEIILTPMYLEGKGK